MKAIVSLLVTALSLQLNAGQMNPLSIHECSCDVFTEVMSGKNSDATLLIPEGSCIPLSVDIRGVLGVNEGQEERAPLMVIVNEALYLRNHEGQLQLSSDNLQWMDLEEYFTGQISGSLQLDETKGPTLRFDLDLNRRTPETPAA